jgi:hypothetical protein
MGWAGGTTEVSGTSTQSATSSSSTIVLLLKFADRDEPTFFTKEYMDDLVFGPKNSLRDFVSENSYGKVILTGRTYGWYTMPSTFRDYSMPHPTVRGMFQYRFYNGQAVSAPRIILNDAIKLAEASGVERQAATCGMGIRRNPRARSSSMNSGIPSA